MSDSLNDELDIGQMAAEALAGHVSKMGASSGHFEVPAEGGVWVVEVKWKPKEK